MSTVPPEDPKLKFEAMIAAHPALRREAYDVVLEAIRFLQEKQEKQTHLSAAELVRGLLEYAAGQYGPFAAAVLGEWGLHSPADVGDAVYNLIGIGRLAASEDDDPGDFPKVEFWFDNDPAPVSAVIPPLPKIDG
ncbi:MAG: hypothetical protein J6R85_05050 [Lentisphaeria bacterium]|nr:hypothetical protein [Lentisphaeria bacterium]